MGTLLRRLGLNAPQPPRQAWARSAARFVAGAFLAALAAVLLGIPVEPAGWSVVAAIVVLGETTGQSVSASVNRAQGSVVGVLSGAIVQTLLPGLPLPLLVALAVLVSLVACRVLRVGAGQRLGLALAGFFVFIPGADEWQMVAWRLFATLLGIGIALLVSSLLWPSSSRARLHAGIAEVATALCASMAASLVRWDPPDASDAAHPPAAVPPAPASLVPRVTALRGLLAEIAHEPPGDGPSSADHEAILDGVAWAVRSADRLARSAVPGPAHLARHLRTDVDALEAAAERLARAIGPALADPADRAELAAASDALAGADARIAAAIEAMRARNVTPGADATELLALFAVADSLLVICEGLRRAAAPLLPAPPPVRASA